MKKNLNKETWLKLTEQEKCDILNSYRGRTDEWKTDNPDWSYSSARNYTDFLMTKDSQFIPNKLSSQGSKMDYKCVLTNEEVKYIKELFKSQIKPNNEPQMTMKGIRRDDLTTTSVRLSKELYNRLVEFQQSELNENEFSASQLISIAIKEFLNKYNK